MKAPVFERRATNLITLRVPLDANITRIRIQGHKTLMGVATAPVTMFEAPVGQHFRSPSIVTRGVERLPSNSTLRHFTVLSFDPDDYQPLSVSLPFDKDILFIKAEGYSPALPGWLAPSPILPIPPPIFFGTAHPALALTGTAPGLTAVPGAVPPSNALAISLPRAARVGDLINLTSGETLLIATGEGMPMIPVPYGAGSSIDRDGLHSDVYLASASANAIGFSIFFAFAV